MERYRNLPCIGVLRKELITSLNVRVHFFSHLKDIVGASEGEIQLEDDATIGGLLGELYERHPRLRDWDTSLLLIGARVEFVDRDYVINRTTRLQSCRRCKAANRGAPIFFARCPFSFLPFVIPA